MGKEDKIERKSGLDVAGKEEVQSRNGTALSIPLDARCGFGPARPTLLMLEPISFLGNTRWLVRSHECSSLG